MRIEKRSLVMATELLHHLMERSNELTPDEKQRLARFLSEQTANSNGDEESTSPKLPKNDPRKGQLAIAWLKAHAQEYAGQHVALDGDSRYVMHKRPRRIMDTRRRSSFTFRHERAVAGEVGSDVLPPGNSIAS